MLRELIKEIDGTTIEHKRILTFPETEVSSVTLSVVEQKAPTKISEMETFLINKKLVEK